MKKLMALAAACALLASMLAGCGHKHDFRITADTDRHFELCEECGQKRNSQKHKLDEDGFCTVCGAEVMSMGDSDSGTIYRYDEKGNLTEIVDYDDDGNVIYSERWVYEYDGENIKSCKEYMDGVLMCESFYLPRVKLIEGEDAVYCAEIIYYYEDGTKEQSKYNEIGEHISYTPYDEEGKPYYTETYTYEYDADGRVSKRTVSSNGKLSREYYYEVGEFDMDYEKKVVYFDENGKIIREEEYDFYGNLLSAVGELPMDPADEELYEELPEEFD